MLVAEPGTILIYSDIACPWSHLAVYRLWRTRDRLGKTDKLRFDHRAFPLELFNERATPKATLDAEIPVAGGLDPTAGWHVWDRAIWEYPGTTLLALEAVQVAKRQGLAPSETLDRNLRLAFFRDRRNISLRHEIVAAAERTEGLDTERLVEDLDSGTARREVLAQMELASGSEVKGSPHLFLPDGSDAHNPGIELHWEQSSFPVIDKDDPSIYEDIVERAAGG